MARRRAAGLRAVSLRAPGLRRPLLGVVTAARHRAGGPGVVGRPLYWAPLGWGEPVIRWWGHPRFVGVAWWGGWGGPRVVNNVVVSRTTTVNVTNITVYRNVNVTNAVVGVPADRFGQGAVRPTRLADQSVARQLSPVRGAVDVRPVAASVTGSATA